MSEKIQKDIVLEKASEFVFLENNGNGFKISCDGGHVELSYRVLHDKVNFEGIFYSNKFDGLQIMFENQTPLDKNEIERYFLVLKKTLFGSFGLGLFKKEDDFWIHHNDTLHKTDMIEPSDFKIPHFSHNIEPSIHKKVGAFDVIFELEQTMPNRNSETIKWRTKNMTIVVPDNMDKNTVKKEFEEFTKNYNKENSKETQELPYFVRRRYGKKKNVECFSFSHESQKWHSIQTKYGNGYYYLNPNSFIIEFIEYLKQKELNGENKFNV